MPENSLSQAIVVVNTAVRRHGTEATRTLFDHYRTSRGEAQDAFVLALIGEVVTGHAIRAAAAAHEAHRAEDDLADAVDQYEFEQGELTRLGFRKPGGGAGDAPSSGPSCSPSHPGGQWPPSDGSSAGTQGGSR